MTEKPKKVRKVTLFSDSDSENDDNSSNNKLNYSSNKSNQNSNGNPNNTSNNTSSNTSSNTSNDSITNSHNNPQTETEILVAEMATNKNQQNNLDSIDSPLEDEMVMHSDKEDDESEDEEILQPTKKMKISKVTFSSDSE